MNVVTKLPEREKNPETCCASVKQGNTYVNPWPSAEGRDRNSNFSFGLIFKLLYMNAKSILKSEKNEKLKVDLDLEAVNKFSENEELAIQLIWLGHAAFLLQINKFNILFDPLLSNSASPISFVGPYRCRGRGFKSFSELPPIDLVILSHNHYDHLDKATIKEIFNEPKNVKTKIFCPLDLKEWFVGLGIPEDQVFECDWWDDFEIAHLTEEEEKNKVSASESTQKITVSCVPSQHFSGRWLNDSNFTLWAGWVIKSKDVSYYFAGDTGYRSLPDNYDIEKIDDYPACPVFKQIGNIHGPFDLASIPIGPTIPPSVMSPIHTTPFDAVNIHLDVQSKHSIAMHWGTVENLGTDDIESGPEELHSAMEKRSLPLNQFHEVYIGQVISLKKSETITNSKN